MKTPKIALMYDFDKTLCTKDMQEYSFIPNVGMTSEEFWTFSEGLAKERKMDKILAYMYTMLTKAKAAEKRIWRRDFVDLGGNLEYFDGVQTWFERINGFVEDMDTNIEHYIISSGLKEIIEGSSIFDSFKEVFACEFDYDENGAARWPKNAVNYTTKTQYLFRINKGVLDVTDDKALNEYTPEEDRPIPFRNMLYIGDGLTDVPCMKLVKANGGYSIAVYQEGKREKVESLLMNKRVDFIAPANYSENSELDKIVKDIIMKMIMEDSLKMKSKAQMEAINSKV